jgi:heat shock protein beta
MFASFFSRVDRVLRRSLGVSETAPTDTKVKPAPPVDPEIHPEPATEEMPVLPEDDTPGIKLPEHLKDQVRVS